MSSQPTASEATKEKFNKMRQKFSAFYEHVKAGHKKHENTNHGHDLSHDVTVALIALEIAPDPRTGEKAWVAAMLHSMDYWKRCDKETFKQFVGTALEKLIIDDVGVWSEREIDEITNAALRHGEKNRNDQCLVQQVLQDADRLSILTVAALFRIGQGHVQLPAAEFAHVDEKNPASTYTNPRSCLDLLRDCLSEFEPQFRLPKAKKLAVKHISILNGVVNLIKDEHARLGLSGLEL